MKLDNGVVKSGEFSYVRQPRTLKAYGQEYSIPARTVGFSGKLEDVAKKVSSAVHTSDTIMAIREGIALFIGNDEMERIFPIDSLDAIDVDEILAFWQALNFELERSQNELLAKYRPAPKVRKI